MESCNSVNVQELAAPCVVDLKLNHKVCESNTSCCAANVREPSAGVNLSLREMTPGKKVGNKGLILVLLQKKAFEMH